MKKLFFAAAAATILFASCAKEGADKNSVPEGEATKMGLSFTFPGMETRAEFVDGNASGNEMKVKDVTVFIFKTDGSTGTVTTRPIANFTETSENVYSLQSEYKIATTTGTKRIYVGMNLPASIKALTTESDLSTALAFTMSEMATADGMAMFCTDMVEKILITDESQNVVALTVERMVAKVGASYSGTGSPAFNGSKTVDGVEYVVEKVGVGQDGTSMYPYKQSNGTKLLTPGVRNGVPNKSALKAINAAGTLGKDLTSSSYAGENAAPTNLRKDVAYAVFQTKFIPSKIAKLVSGSVDASTNNPAVGPTDMWVLFSDEGTYFCASEADKIEIVEAEVLTNVKEAYYDKGYCYYFVFLNKGAPGKLCELHRNDFIHLEVTDILGLGTPGNKDDGEQPEDPEDPEIPVIEEATNLLVNVNVTPWNYGKVTGVVLE